MGGISSLGIAVSGLNAAQAGLYVTGHNMANSGIAGYSRQRVVQSDYFYSNIGQSANGALKTGLGTNIAGIQQIRNTFLDVTYRNEVSKLYYYDVKAATGIEVEAIIGELQSRYNTQSVIQDVWDAINELSLKPQGLETRGLFISSCVTFLDKVNNVYERLNAYQHNLDEQIRSTVTQVNELVAEINGLNSKIISAEIPGDSANDYRDRRNVCLDELSKLLDIDYKEMSNGRIDIFTEGNELLVNGFQNKLGLKFSSPNYSFVEPVFTKSSTILPYDHPTAKSLYNYNTTVSALNDNDNGKLKALFYTRGLAPGHYASTMLQPPNVNDSVKYPNGKDDPAYITDKDVYERQVANAKNFMIPQIMHDLDTVVHEIVTMINDAVAPYANGVKDTDKAPYDTDTPPKQTFTEIFVRKTVDRFKADGTYNDEYPNDYYSLYTLGNIIINPDLLKEGGYNLISLSQSGDIEDPSVALGLLEKWKDKSITLMGGDPQSINDAYKKFVTGIATQTSEAVNYCTSQTILVDQADNKRMSIAGVSLDEEMKNMMVYQHAYNAASRILNVIDSMIDRVVNGTGRSGL